MTYYLLNYDRKEGQLRSIRSFVDASEATRQRFRLELEFINQPEVEIVVLGAESEGQLRETHRRFFSTIEELASAMTHSLMPSVTFTSGQTGRKRDTTSPVNHPPMELPTNSSQESRTFEYDPQRGTWIERLK